MALEEERSPHHGGTWTLRRPRSQARDVAGSLLGLGLLAGMIILSGLYSPAFATGGNTALVSRADGLAGTKGDDDSVAPSISGDGHDIAFASLATNLDPAATNGVFARDLEMSTTRLVSRATGATGAGADGAHPAFSANGRYVAFESQNLDPEPPRTWNIFVRDLQTDTTTLVSRANGPTGARGDEISFEPSISADGRYVAFTSQSNLDPADTGLQDVYVRDLQTDTTILVSRASGASGAKGNDHSFRPSISADGRYVAFESRATNLVPDDTDDGADIYVRDLQEDATTLVSRADGVTGTKANNFSHHPSISADGRWVAFDSSATDLDPADPDGTEDVFARDLEASTTTLVSRAPGASGVKGDDNSRNPSISADGRYIAFHSVARNLSTRDDDGILDVYFRDLLTNATILISRASGASGTKGNGDSGAPSISASGRYVAFHSTANNLHPADSDHQFDVYRRDVLGPPGPDADGDGVPDASDKCPAVAAHPGTPDGCPPIARSLTLRYSNRSHAFKGRLSSAVATCRGDQPVKVFRKRRGHDRKLGQAITTPNGRYRVHQKRHPGRYYANTGETVIPSAGRCEEARSKVRRLR